MRANRLREVMPALRMAARAAPLALAIGSIVPQPGAAQQNGPEPPIATRDRAGEGGAFRIGIVQSGNVERLLDDLRPMARNLEALIDRPVEILPMASYSALADAHVLGRLDLAFYATLAFLAADTACGCVEPLVAPAAANGDVALSSLLMVRRGAGLRTWDDLAGGRIVVGPQGALATWIWPRAQLASEGIDLESVAGEIHRVASPVRALEMLANGESDAALIWGAASTEAKDDVPRGPLGQAERAGIIDSSELVALWRSRPLPHGPVAVRSSVDGELKGKIRQFLVELDETAPDVYDRLDRYYGGGYVSIDRRSYRDLRSLIRDRP